MSIDNETVRKQNAIVRHWIPGVQRELRSSASWFRFGKSEPFITRGTGSKMRTEGKLVNSIKPSTKQSFGEIDTISFSFERHGIFVHKGVGRGWEMNGKVVRRTAKGKMTGGGRNVVEWFNPVIDRNVPELADQIAIINADAVINAAKLSI
jgi:hypothetical protein